MAATDHYQVSSYQISLVGIFEDLVKLISLVPLQHFYCLKIIEMNEKK